MPSVCISRKGYREEQERFSQGIFVEKYDSIINEKLDVNERKYLWPNCLKMFTATHQTHNCPQCNALMI